MKYLQAFSLLSFQNKLKRGKKNSNFKCVWDWVVARLPQSLKSTFFEKKILHSGFSLGATLLEKISNNIDFSP